MGTVFYLLTSAMFGIGATAGLLLIVLCSIDREWNELPRLVFGTIAMAAMAWTMWRAWRRERQKRAFLRETQLERTSNDRRS